MAGLLLEEHEHGLSDGRSLTLIPPHSDTCTVVSLPASRTLETASPTLESVSLTPEPASPTLESVSPTPEPASPTLESVPLTPEPISPIQSEDLHPLTPANPPAPPYGWKTHLHFYKELHCCHPKNLHHCCCHRGYNSDGSLTNWWSIIGTGPLRAIALCVMYCFLCCVCIFFLCISGS